MSTPSEVITTPHELHFDLSSLAGLTLDNLTESVEAVDGTIEIEPGQITIESTNPPKPPQSPQNQAVTSVAIQAEQPPTKKRGRGRPKKSEQAKQSETNPQPEVKSDSPIVNSMIGKFESPELPDQADPPTITHGHPSPTAICICAAAFGFQIPPVTASSWMPQTLANIANTISSWEDDLRHCNERKPVIESARQGIPPLIAQYDKPTDKQIETAKGQGVTAATIDDRSLRNQLNLYPPGSILARSWTEGFDAADDPKKSKPEAKVKAKPDLTANQSAMRDLLDKSLARGQVEIDRQSAIDNLLLQIFAERDTIQSLKEEIDEHKSAAKELSETREEHVGKVGMLLDELRLVSKGEGEGE